VASPTHVNRNFVSKSHSAWVKKYVCFSARTRKSAKISSIISSKVYISRSRLSRCCRQLDIEKELEELLSLDGWLIFHPEEHSIEEQIKAYESCEQICGLEGSAIHLLFGISPKNLKQVVLLCRNSENNCTKQLNAQNIKFIALDCLKFDPKCTKIKTQRNIIAKEGINAVKLVKFIHFPFLYKAYIVTNLFKSILKATPKAV
jgi:capsular polysaccharide biosynthesis protein